MSKKERLEDLGRLALGLEQLLEMDIFEDDEAPKFQLEKWDSLSQEDKYLVAREWFYFLDDTRSKLRELSYLASGISEE